METRNESRFCELLDQRELSDAEWDEFYRLARELDALDSLDAVAACEAIDQLEAGVVRVQ